MKKVQLLFLAAAVGTVAWTAAERSKIKHPVSNREISVPGRDGAGVLLMSGWRIQSAGRQLATGDMILSAALSPDGKTLAVTNSGYTRHYLRFIDVATEKETAKFEMERSWSGLAWSPDGKTVFASGGVANPNADILVFRKFDEKTWAGGRNGLPLLGSKKESNTVSSITVSADGRTLYATNSSDDHLYVADLTQPRALSRTKVGVNPISARLSKDGKTLYVANIGSSEISVMDVTNPEKPVLVKTLKTDSHPNDIVLSADDRLFVSCGDTNNVLAFDLKTGDRMESIVTALSPKAPAGSTPNSMVISPDGESLYVANADNNNVAVIDITQRGKAQVKGFIPTGWYPTMVRITADGKKLIVGSGKGMGLGPNWTQTPYSKEAANNFLHHGNNLNGLVSFVDRPSASQLSAYTKTVMENTPYRDVLLEKAETTAKTVIPVRVGEKSPIEHVLYILKENRTYDQVFSDLKQGMGDDSLLLFGREVTPNHHALAEQFVLLDNLYCSGEVSQDGHPWSTSAYATDFTQRAWTLGYSQHGRLVHGRSSAEQSSDYIWEAAAKKGLTVRAYGYGGRRGLDSVRSMEFDRRSAPGEASRDRDYLRADRFIEEFKQLEKSGKVPNFMMMSLGEDHTSGTAPGAFTPKAQVASNDLAIGKIVEAISKSSLWPKTAIFIIEDDAQNGPDHIDSHRTVGLVISAYTKRKHVDSTMYSTTSMLRTMELLLGLPPLTQHDAASTPMFDSFMDRTDLSTYTALPARIDLQAKNAPNAYGSSLSAKMDFSAYDRADEQALNKILWHSIKGEHLAMPAPVRRALPTRNGLLTFSVAADDEDDD